LRFFALAFEFFLRRLEACDARCDFFPLGSGVVLFAHAHPFFDSCPVPIGRRDWGANGDGALQDCGVVTQAVAEFLKRSTFAVDKRAGVLVAFSPSR